MDNLERIKQIIPSLTYEQLLKLQDIVLCTKETNIKDLEHEKYDNGRYCPHCGASNKDIVRNGTRKNGEQKFFCKKCGKHFVATTNTILFHTRKSPEDWDKFMECYIRGDKLKECAETCDISISTAFFWRHKINSVLEKLNDEVCLDGIVESDDTYFETSFKGTKQEKPHKRGPSSNTNKYATKILSVDDADAELQDESLKALAKKHPKNNRTGKVGLSENKICVSCAITRDKHVFSKISNLAKPSIEDLDWFFKGKLAPKATIVTDMASSYIKFAQHNDLDHVSIRPGEVKKGIYHINHINSYHSGLKNFLRPFKGISTKHLNGYLAWYNQLDMLDMTMKEKKEYLMKIIAQTPKTITYKEIRCKKNLPIRESA